MSDKVRSEHNFFWAVLTSFSKSIAMVVGRRRKKYHREKLHRNNKWRDSVVQQFIYMIKNREGTSYFHLLHRKWYSRQVEGKETAINFTEGPICRKHIFVDPPIKQDDLYNFKIMHFSLFYCRYCLILYIMFDLSVVSSVNKIITPTSIIFIYDFAQHTYKYSNCDSKSSMIFFIFREEISDRLLYTTLH